MLKHPNSQSKAVDITVASKAGSPVLQIYSKILPHVSTRVPPTATARCQTASGDPAHKSQIRVEPQNNHTNDKFEYGILKSIQCIQHSYSTRKKQHLWTIQGITPVTGGAQAVLLASMANTAAQATSKTYYI